MMGVLSSGLVRSRQPEVPENGQSKRRGEFESAFVSALLKLKVKRLKPTTSSFVMVGVGVQR